MPDALRPPADSAKEELRAAVHTRRELGPDYEDAVLDSFLDRVERSIDARVDARVQRQGASAPVAPTRGEPRDGPGSEHGQRSFILGIVSLGTGIPLTAISAGTEGLPGLAVAWIGIVGVNVAHALSRRQG